MASDLRAPDTGAVPLPPAAQAYQRELARVLRLQAQLEDILRVGPAHELETAQRLGPLIQHRLNLQRQLVTALDGWLEHPDRALSRIQSSTLRETLCRRAESLAEDGDAAMAAVHDRRSPVSLALKRQARADRLRQQLDETFGHARAGALEGEDPDAVWRSAMDRLRADRDAQAQRRQARQESRQARKARQSPAPDQLEEAQRQRDADTTLRQIYRRLASALHPDRETDDAQRQRKTAWMSTANAAYDRQDMLTLMDLQRQVDELAPEALDRVPEQKLASLTRLLRRQATDLERERQAAQRHWTQRLQLPAGVPLSLPALQGLLERQEKDLQIELGRLERDLQAMQDLPSLKSWLNRLRDGSVNHRPRDPHPGFS